jgi:hypothetical protein
MARAVSTPEIDHRTGIAPWWLRPSVRRGQDRGRCREFPRLPPPFKAVVSDLAAGGPRSHLLLAVEGGREAVVCVVGTRASKSRSRLRDSPPMGEIDPGGTRKGGLDAFLDQDARSRSAAQASGFPLWPPGAS